MRLYIGCALSVAPPSFVESIHNLKNQLRAHYSILDFLGYEGTDREVFEFDLAQVRSSDAVLAICDYPSTGLGFEIASALSWNKRVWAVAEENTRVSRMISGINFSHFSFHRYKNLEIDVPRILAAH